MRLDLPSVTPRKKLSLNIDTSVIADVNRYAQMLSKRKKVEVPVNLVVEGMLRQFMKEDPEFNSKARREASDATQTSSTDGAADGQA